MNNMAKFRQFIEVLVRTAPFLEPLFEELLRTVEVDDEAITAFRCVKVKDRELFVALEQS